MMAISSIYNFRSTAENHKRRPLYNQYSFVAATIFVSRKVKIREFKMLYFQSERHYRTENLQNDSFLDDLQPSIDKNSEDLTIASFGTHFLKHYETAPQCNLQWPIHRRNLKELCPYFP